MPYSIVYGTVQYPRDQQRSNTTATYIMSNCSSGLDAETSGHEYEHDDNQGSVDGSIGNATEGGATSTSDATSTSRAASTTRAASRIDLAAPGAGENTESRRLHNIFWYLLT